MKKKYSITNQRELRRKFWEQYPQLSRKKIGKGTDRGFCADTRCAFVDWIDHLCRSDEISTALAERATLQ